MKVHFSFIDINECSASPSVCDSNANCRNTKGSYLCSCNVGFTGDGKTCKGKKEVLHKGDVVFFLLYINWVRNVATGEGVVVCWPTVSSTLPPSILCFGRGSSCCPSVSSAPPSTLNFATTVEWRVEGGGGWWWKFACLPSLVSKSRNVTLCISIIDINECSASPSVCDSNANCQNTNGSYLCSCNVGFTGDGKTCRGNKWKQIKDM